MILEWGRYPGDGNNPPQYSCLGTPMDRGAWWAAVHGVPKSWTLSDSQQQQKEAVRKGWLEWGEQSPSRKAVWPAGLSVGLRGGMAAGSSAWNCRTGHRRESVVLID